MGRGRIAFASEEPLLLTFDGELLLAFDAVTLASRWKLELPRPILAVVYASSSALPRVHAGSPWRSPSSGSDALVVDRDGGIHAVDAAAGRLLGSLAPVGKPVAVAASAVGDGLAVALADRLLLWHDGRQHELPLRASALAFSRDSLALAVGTAKGELHEVTPATRAVGAACAVKGAVRAIAPRRTGEWVVATEEGTYHVSGAERVARLRDGGLDVACDPSGQVLAVQPTVDRVIVCEWPRTPVTRIEMAGRPISGLELMRDRLAVAVLGGDANVVRLGGRTHVASKPHPGRSARPWTLHVESELDAATRSDGGRNRFGVGAFLTLVVLLLCMGYLSSSTKQSWVPPPPFFIVDEACDLRCAIGRAAELAEMCRQTASVACAPDAEEAEAALEIRACDEAKAAFGRARHRLGARDDGAHAQLSAQLALTERGVSQGCTAPPESKRLAVVHLSGRELTPEHDATPFVGSDPRMLWAGEDGALLLATTIDDRCAFRRKLPGEGWRTLRTQSSSCRAATFWAKSATDVYVALGAFLRHYDGHAWTNLDFPGLEVLAIQGTRDGLAVVDINDGLYTYRGNVWTKVALPRGTHPRDLAGNGGELVGLGLTDGDAGAEGTSVFLRPRAGGSWEVLKGPPAPGAIWLAPDGRVFGINGWSADVTRWSRDDEPRLETMSLPGVVERVWGRTSRDVFAGGPRVLVHYDGETWEETSFRQRVRLVTGNSKDLWVVSDRP